MIEEERGDSVHDVLRSSGRPLAEPVRTEMEARLGADFSTVRVHDDSTAQRSAAEIGAHAYTSANTWCWARAAPTSTPLPTS